MRFLEGGQIARGLVAAAAVLWLAAPVARAGAPSSFPFGGPGARIVDLTGNYDLSDPGFDITYSVVQDAKGRLSGSGSAGFEEDGITVDIAFIVKGKVTGSSGAGGTRVVLKLQGAGTATDGIEVIPVTFKLSARTVLIDDPIGGSRLTGTARLRLCARGFGCEQVVETFDEPVDDEGGWTVTFALSRVGNLVTGTAEVMLDSSGRTFGYTARGKFRAADTTARIGLRPLIPSEGTFKFILLVEDGVAGAVAPLDVLQVKGKLLGQRVVVLDG
jgi:hypothetical protein